MDCKIRIFRVIRKGDAKSKALTVLITTNQKKIVNKV